MSTIYPKNILFIIQDLNWQFNQGGAANQILHILNSLLAAGINVHLQISRRDKSVVDVTDFSSPSFINLSFSTHPVFRGFESTSRWLQTNLKLPWTQSFDSLRILDALMQQSMSYELFHERNSMHGFGVALASKRLKKPYVLSVDADFLYEHDFMGIKHTYLERKIAELTATINYKSAHAITCVSKVMKNHLVNKWHIEENKIFVIPNGSEINALPQASDIQAKRVELGLDNLPVIVFVGNFWPWHGLDMLIEAFHLVHNAMSSSRLALVGDGIIRLEIEKKVEEEGLSEYVIFVGKVPHELVSLFIGLADVVVAPYPRMEIPFWGSPMKIFEYMAAGKPIVASNAGEIGEIIKDHETGLLVEPGDIPATAEAILYLLRNSKVANGLGIGARQAITQQYTWDNYVETLVDVYHFAISQNSIGNI